MSVRLWPTNRKGRRIMPFILAPLVSLGLVAQLGRVAKGPDDVIVHNCGSSVQRPRDFSCVYLQIAISRPYFDCKENIGALVVFLFVPSHVLIDNGGAVRKASC